MSGATDQRRVRRSARQIGLWTGAASAIVLAAGVGILVTVILLTARPEGGPDGDDPRGPGAMDHIVVDVDRVVPWVIVLGVVGVVLLGLIAWAAARQAVKPLGEALRTQRNFLADASHELRTPLTAMSSRVQILQRRHARGAPIDDTVDRLRRDVAAMDDILTELLLAARGDQLPTTASADVATAIAAAVDTLRPLADDAGVRLEPSVTGTPAVRMPEVTLTRLCVALIDNAVYHSPRGTGSRSASPTRGRASGRRTVRGSSRGSRAARRRGADVASGWAWPSSRMWRRAWAGRSRSSGPRRRAPPSCCRCRRRPGRESARSQAVA